MATNSGSFPAILDSDSASNACKDLAKAYFDCRMQAGLMTREDLSNLGFGAERTVGQEEVDREFVGKEAVLAELEAEIKTERQEK